VRFKPASFLGWAILMALAAVPAAAGPYGKISGIVVDPKGTPQMGATVLIRSEALTGGPAPLQLLSNERGAFSSDKILPGAYTVRVTLAGFLPTVERHVRIDPSLTTMLRVELNSVFSSLDRLRRKPKHEPDPDEWAWVLRSSPATRPVLQYSAEEAAAGHESRRSQRVHGRVELTSGARRPGSPSNLADAPSTAFAYEQGIGVRGRLVMAGQASYERGAAASLSTLWLPGGEAGRGPRTSMVLRRSTMGPGGPVFRGARIDHASQFMVGDSVLVRYGAEYILVGLGKPASSFRPRTEVAWLMGPEWQASLTVAPRPLATGDLGASPMQTALFAMDAFPAVMMRDSRVVLEGGWHEEAAVERHIGPNTRFVASVFHDRGGHTAVFGRGPSVSPDMLQDYFSNAFTYDGGSSASWGTRVVYEQKIAGEWDATFIYAYGGALATVDSELPPDAELRDLFRTAYRHSVAAKASGRLPRMGTRVAVSYKWISGEAVSRQDAYGEGLYQLDPALNVSFRQPLPRMFLPGKVEALADFRNLLAQGYVPVNTAEGQVVLIPALRSFRGGLSFQF
jgi:hypothetical protein